MYSARPLSHKLSVFVPASVSTATLALPGGVRATAPPASGRAGEFRGLPSALNSRTARRGHGIVEKKAIGATPGAGRRACGRVGEASWRVRARAAPGNEDNAAVVCAHDGHAHHGIRKASNKVKPAVTPNSDRLRHPDEERASARTAPTV
jgi:hypothetical protein